MMEFSEFKKELSKYITNIDSWKFTKINHGKISPNKFIITKGKKKLFVKEINSRESEILIIINKLGSKVSPKIIIPSLLSKNILVQDFASGGHLKGTKLDDQLIINFTKLQNELNKKKYLQALNRHSVCKYPHKDDGSFKSWIKSSFDNKKILLNFKRKYGLKIINDYLEIYRKIALDKNIIIESYPKMPFAIYHNDFKDNNIIGDKLIDWGSFYGYGPFLHDMAIFLLGNNHSIELYIKSFWMSQEFSQEQIKRWVYASATRDFLDFLKRIPNNCHNKKETDKFMKKYYPLYRKLLE